MQFEHLRAGERTDDIRCSNCDGTPVVVESATADSLDYSCPSCDHTGVRFDD